VIADFMAEETLAALRAPYPCDGCGREKATEALWLAAPLGRAVDGGMLFVALSHQCRAGYHVSCHSFTTGYCACRCHGAQRFDLATVAPLLARARDQRVAELGRERELRRRARDLVTETERIVAHRELQLVRALGTRNRDYMKHRQRKLAEAHRRLARAQAIAEALHA
jgi:hypothetical protein